MDLGQARAVSWRLWRWRIGLWAAASVGASLPYRGTGKICVNLQRDGEMLYTPSALWTAANTGVPLLTVMTNNRVYYNDVEHQEKVALHRGRPVENKLVGMEMAKLPVDLPIWPAPSVFMARDRSPKPIRFARR